MSKMSTIDRNCFTIRKASHILPHNFLISKWRPSMSFTFLNKFFNSASSRSYEKGFSCDWIVISYLTSICSNFLKPWTFWFNHCISWMLSVVSIKTTNTISCFKITTVFEILLDWLLTSSVSFLTHNTFFTINWVVASIHLNLTSEKS